MKEKKNPRVDELRGEIATLEATYQRDLRTIAGEAEKATHALVKVTGEKIAKVGRTLAEAMMAVREARDKARNALHKDYSNDLRQAASRRDRGLHELDRAFEHARDEANNNNTEAVKPIEAELLQEQRNLSVSLRERLEARKEQFQADARPLVEELTQLEASLRGPGPGTASGRYNGEPSAVDVVVTPSAQ
jgi:hypothetical protein